MILTDNIFKGEIPEKQAIYKLEKIKNSFLENKRAIDTIIPPGEFADDHKNFIRIFNYCIESSDMSLSAIDMEHGKIETERILHAKVLINDFKVYIQYLSHRSHSRITNDFTDK